MSSFQQILTEIAEKVAIDRDFTISHPDYPPLVTNPETIDKLQQIAVELQARYLTAQVQKYLHDIYFSHSLLSSQELNSLATNQTVKNNMVDGIDIDFYPRLIQSNTSRGYFDLDWEIVAQTDRGELIVVKNGLHLHVDPHQHLSPEFDRSVGNIVPIRLPPNLVGKDTYIAIGNAGIPDSESTIEIYFNFTPDAAVEICRTLTIELNKLGIPFQFAILHDPALFHRYDAGTLELSQSHYQLVQPVLTEIYQIHQAAFSPPVPLFSKQLAPGLGLAETPTSFDRFGMNRCQLVATGLVLAISRGQISSAEKLNSIEQEFGSAEINLQQPHLNLAEIVGVGGKPAPVEKRNENRYCLLFG